MRSRSTNVLQVIVLLTGIVYILIGGIFFFSPVKFANIFSVYVADDWLSGMQYDIFIAPLYILARTFAVMVLTAGIAMVLPLYDPLKYRGLIYYTGIIFPAISAVMLLINSMSVEFSFASGIDIRIEHWILTICGLIFLCIFSITLFGLMLTYKKAKAGIE